VVHLVSMSSMMAGQPAKYCGQRWVEYPVNNP